MDKHTKTFDFKLLEQRKDGGRILISTGNKDRDNDRVIPNGARTENYAKNPIVQWGHNYRDPWATIGKTNLLEITPDGIVSDFTLRPAANEQDPQNVVLLLWNGNWVRTASIGFMPAKANPNDLGGFDFLEWELLEWSLVPIPANQDALRLAVKSFDDLGSLPTMTIAPVEKRGRVLSARNEQKIRDAVAGLQEVLAQLDAEPPDSEASESEIVLSRHILQRLDLLHAHLIGNKGALPPHTTPKADEDVEWDAASAVRDAEGEKELRLIHAWVNSEGDPNAKQSYKLPHHLRDGRVVLRGVQAAGNAMMGARGGVAIPDDDVDGVQAHLARHYRQFEQTPPWEQNESLPESAEDAKTLRELEELFASLKQLRSAVASKEDK